MAVFPDSFLPTRQVTLPATEMGVESRMLRKRLTRTPISFTESIAYSAGRGVQSGRWLDRAGVGEAVPDPRDGQDVIRTRGLRLDLAAQVSDVDVDHPGFDWILITPDRVQDLLPAEHLAGVAGEEGEQVELGVGQLDLLARFVDAALVDIDDQIAELEPRPHRLGRLHAGSPQVGRNPGRQLAQPQRLGDVVVG